ncbi:SIS domain-containing protein [Lactobacillus sakei] [Lactiplantibacillus mudanjiangensis]|uniref:SIS domain-containing protein n=1 Tax=Lactiplantibacillus mudanjiangensis TaxID=1296538 RepID=UPI001014A005|nr:SIS domain-containing protein [Lactobacillus sakei] [Lactiplantibacillus mudanjiangensis]
MKNPTMLTYINQEPTVLTQILAQYPTNIETALADMPIHEHQWLVLATGSSINAATSAKYYIQNIAGVKLNIEQPYNYAHFEPLADSEKLVIGISQSGQSTSTIDAIEAIRKVKAIKNIAVTSIPGTELTQCCDNTLDILTGRERVGYVSLGFSATVLNLMLLGLRVARLTNRISAAQETQELADLQAIVDQIDTTIDVTTTFAKTNQAELTATTQFTSVAFGPMVGIANELETKFTETVRIPTHGFELEAFMHGPYLSVNPHHEILFFKTAGQPAVTTKLMSLLNYEAKYTKHVFTANLVDDSNTNDAHQLNLPVVTDINKAPLLGATVLQVLAWYMTKFHGIDLSHLIYNDFSEVVHNKTEVQDYV